MWFALKYSLGKSLILSIVLMRMKVSCGYRLQFLIILCWFCSKWIWGYCSCPLLWRDGENGTWMPNLARERPFCRIRSFHSTAQSWERRLWPHNEAEEYTLGCSAYLTYVLSMVLGWPWTKGNIGATEGGLHFCEEYEIIPAILEIAEKSPIPSVRGYELCYQSPAFLSWPHCRTCFFVLGLISSTFQGAEILDDYHWEATTTPLAMPTGICIPTDVEKFISVGLILRTNFGLLINAL